MKTYKEMTEGRIVPTHLNSGKPNPNHPAFKTHKAKYDAEKAALPKVPKPKVPKPKEAHPSDKVSIGDFHSGSASAPDIDHFDVIQNVADKHGISFEHAKIGLNRHAKKMGYKSYADHLDDVYAQANESVNEGSEHEIMSDIVKHTEKHIAKYKALGGDEQFGARLHSVGEMLAKKHGVAPKDMHKKVADHIDKQFNESVDEAVDTSKAHFNVVYRDKSGKVQGEKAFTDKDAAHKHAANGNNVDKVGGKYTVHGVSESVDESATPNGSYKDILDKHGFKTVKPGLYSKHEHPNKGSIEISRYGEWVHRHKGEGYNGTTEKSLHNHLSKMNEKTTIPSFAEFIDENSPFDWKKTKSEIDWTGKKAEVKHTETGLIHKAREGDRNAESNAPKEKRGRGRPPGPVKTSYKPRDAAGKAATAAKAMASKRDGLAARKEFKDTMHAAIKKHQLKLAGITESFKVPTEHLHKDKLQ